MRTMSQIRAITEGPVHLGDERCVRWVAKGQSIAHEGRHAPDKVIRRDESVHPQSPKDVCDEVHPIPNCPDVGRTPLLEHVDELVLDILPEIKAPILIRYVRESQVRANVVLWSGSSKIDPGVLGKSAKHERRYRRRHSFEKSIATRQH